MKKDLIINILFVIIELLSGILTGSMAILSDSIYTISDIIDDIVDLYNKKVNVKLFKSLLLTLIMLSGSIIIIFYIIFRLFINVEVSSKSMIFISIIVITLSIYFNYKDQSNTKENDNINRIIRWVVILVSSIVMLITKSLMLDNIISICIALLIVKDSISNLYNITEIYIDYSRLKNKIVNTLYSIEEIKKVYYIHLWNYDDDLSLLIYINAKRKKELEEKIIKSLSNYHIKYLTIEYQNIKKIARKNCNI